MLPKNRRKSPIRNRFLQLNTFLIRRRDQKQHPQFLHLLYKKRPSRLLFLPKSLTSSFELLLRMRLKLVQVRYRAMLRFSCFQQMRVRSCMAKYQLVVRSQNKAAMISQCLQIAMYMHPAPITSRTHLPSLTVQALKMTTMSRRLQLPLPSQRSKTSHNK